MLRLRLLLTPILAALCIPGIAEAQQQTSGAQEGPSAARQRMNVLLITIDDLRPQLGSYGDSLVRSPNLDRLAAEGLVFLRQYVQVPTCGASRYALLTGRRPRTPAHLSNEAFVELLPREEGDRPESLVHHFRRAGYRTVGIGKISHYPDGRVRAYDGSGDGRLEMPFSWDEMEGPIGRWGSAWNAFFGYGDGSSRNVRKTGRPAFEVAEVADDALPDGMTAEAAVRKLGELATAEEPFFLAVGFFKPHLPFVAPRRYWEMYDPSAIPISPNPEAPVGVNRRSLHDSNELFRNYDSHPQRGGAGVRISDDYARTLRHAYLASVSYVDAQVGRVLAELDRLALRDNTIVIVWGDHGWHLGDHTIWGKHTTFERSLHSPLIMRVPGMIDPGRSTDAIVEAVDLYPTLAELCGLSTPEGLDGQSFAKAFSDPAFRSDGLAYGYSQGRTTLRTDRFRITEYVDGEPRVELYDHAVDPLETRNVAASHPEVVRELLPILRRHAPRADRRPQ